MRLRRKITPRTKMIVPVHLGGFPVDMDPIMELAKKHGLFVMEDAAHGMGGMYKGRKLGTIAHFGGFSLHEVKNINSLGEGGILLTNASKEKPQMAEVLAVGPGAKDVEMVVKVGDKVVYQKYAGTEVKVDGQEVIVIKQGDILAIVE